MAVLDAAGVSKRFGGVIALDGLDLHVDDGEVLALIGPNGAGKSTCFNILNGQLRPDSGRVRLFGTDVTGAGPLRIGRLGVGRTFQIAATFPSMSVSENVQMALIGHRRRTRSLWARAARQFVGEARDLLQLVGMADQAGRPCSVLSYGDLKRLELAIALSGRPRLLLMDEPTAGMAPAERTVLMELVDDIVRTQGLSVLFTEHDMDVVFQHADRIAVLHRGRLIASGPPEAVRADPTVQDIYLGTDGPTAPDGAAAAEGPAAP
jgi:branched-chain amino acid transport system ATP-binding protein